MKIAPKPKARIEFKEVSCGDVFTVDGSTSTYLRIEELVHIDDNKSQYSVNCVSLGTGNPHWFDYDQKVMVWPDATVTF